MSQFKTLIAGNWKMNLGFESAKQFLNQLDGSVKKKVHHDLIEVVIAPQTPLLYPCLTWVTELNSNIQIASQNSHWAESGAFTGETSVELLKEMGVRWTLIGHSERRQFFAETDETVNQRAHMALNQHLNVILCIGETLDEREAGLTKAVLKKQLDIGLKDLNPDQCQTHLTIAYEPVWAIGTGKTANLAQAEEAHQQIKDTLSEFLGPKSQGIRVLYGGSVKPSNAVELLQSSVIDGVLVGGASLEADSFEKIITAAPTPI